MAWCYSICTVEHRVVIFLFLCLLLLLKLIPFGELVSTIAVSAHSIITDWRTGIVADVSDDNVGDEVADVNTAMSRNGVQEQQHSIGQDCQPECLL